MSAQPPLAVDQILAWADAHLAAHGRWPTAKSGGVAAVPQETWRRIDRALNLGLRGLSGGTSLGRVLHQYRGCRNRFALSPLTTEQILTWADADFAVHGRWPAKDSGTIAAAPGETWSAVDKALTSGHRGLLGGTTLSRLLEQHRGRRSRSTLAHFTVDHILSWADAHFAVHGRWPTAASGNIADAPEETWGRIDNALKRGRRGLSGRASLARLLHQYRGCCNPTSPPRLSIDQILGWADAHFTAHSRWPTTTTNAPIEAAPGERWRAVDQALTKGSRGLPGGTSLARLLAAHRLSRGRNSD